MKIIKNFSYSIRNHLNIKPHIQKINPATTFPKKKNTPESNPLTALQARSQNPDDPWPLVGDSPKEATSGSIIIIIIAVGRHRFALGSLVYLWSLRFVSRNDNNCAGKKITLIILSLSWLHGCVEKILPGSRRLSNWRVIGDDGGVFVIFLRFDCRIRCFHWNFYAFDWLEIWNS